MLWLEAASAKLGVVMIFYDGFERSSSNKI